MAHDGEQNDLKNGSGTFNEDPTNENVILHESVESETVCTRPQRIHVQPQHLHVFEVSLPINRPCTTRTRSRDLNATPYCQLHFL